MNKSSLEEIKIRFNNDVERFSNLETGQVSTIDAQISLDILTKASAAICPQAKSVLDLGCGAGNFTLKLLQILPDLDCTLVDLSPAMLNKAVQRITPIINGKIKTINNNFLDAELAENSFDIVITGSAMHHLRDNIQWECVFKKIYKSLRNNGCFFISDLIKHDNPAIDNLMWQRYADYLFQIGGEEYKQEVFAYIEKEDTPRSINYQLDLMKKIGFSYTEVLHKNGVFAVFGGIKGYENSKINFIW